MMKKILVFGDSIAFGSWDSRGGWSDRLKQELNTWTINSKGSSEYHLHNLGIGGNSSTKILNRMRGEIDTRYSSRYPYVFIFAYGHNDIRSKDGKPETSLKKFKSNTSKIIDIAKEYTDKILFVGPAPLVKEELKSYWGYDFRDDKLKEYDQALKELVENKGANYLELRSEFERVGLKKLFGFDELHPNDAGHQLIYEIVDREIQEYLK